jgi:DNA helicase IV
MLDIVATIQAEQDEVIRAPLNLLLAVQGGPGTGKTAVGLHRAAFLLYNHPELAQQGVLVLGPSRAFLRYIAQVLPSLGEETVLQLTIAELVTKARIRAFESQPVALVKGDARMAEVLAGALALIRSSLTEGVSLSARHLIVNFTADELNLLVGELVAQRLPHAAGRAALRARLISTARRRFRADGRFEADEAWFERELVASKAFAPMLDRLWPRISPHELVNELLANSELRTRAASSLLSPEEIALLQRARPASAARAPWTRSDIALLDEAHALVQGRGRTYGHIIVDEAQDLSPMELRMLSRRCPRRSMTLLGDIAQATGSFTYASWDELVRFLPESSDIRRDELTLGYRAPGQVLDFASRLLRIAAPSVRPTSSVRPGRYEPVITQVERDALIPAAIDEARRLAALGFLVGVIVPSGELETQTMAATRRAVDVGQLERDGITLPITIVSAPGAKGLEFDAVVVVEPAEIAADGRRGLRLLYVAFTRPIQSLSVIHAAPLPAPLADTST